MPKKFSSLVNINKQFNKFLEIRFYESPEHFEKDMEKIKSAGNERVEARIGFNGNVALDEIVKDFTESFPKAKVKDSERYIGLRVSWEDNLIMKQKFVDYFAREGPPLYYPEILEKDIENMTVGEYYNKYLRNPK